MRSLLVAAALLLAGPALAEAPMPVGATPVQLTVGQRLDLCVAALVTPCPVSRFICDDPKVATVESGGTGAVLVGVGAGATLCAVYGYEGVNRRLLAITVAAASKRP